MKTTRRQFVQVAGTGALGAALDRVQAPVLRGRDSGFDVAVVGAGVFGVWTAYQLQLTGRRVALIDAYGPANARGSSGGQSRVIRMGYGDQEIYTRWSMRSLDLWQALLRRTGRAAQFQRSGVLWMAREQDPLTTSTLETLGRLRVRHERLDRSRLAARWPQIDFGPITWAIHEPDSGFLAAFHVVQAVAQAAMAAGVVYMQEAVLPPEGRGQLAAVATRSGRTISATTFVMACGPWLPKLFPDVVGERIFPSRQEVFYFGVPPGDTRFDCSAMPVWADFGEEIYGIPDFRGRGFKVAVDRHGPPADPDSLERVPSAEIMAQVQEFVGRRFPGLKGAPIVGAEVCQYENTSNGDFLIDRHPALSNVWLVGGGSGHGFKHGPVVGEYVAARIADGKPVDPRFSLATKQKIQKRTVY
ncbi:MAG TPA: FAD-dependent oxidoreductase [Vicinamibacterales bacterium]|nr:FAD-dependent oxidoreductase [Vicinamibacterales bacterium]